MEQGALCPVGPRKGLGHPLSLGGMGPHERVQDRIVGELVSGAVQAMRMLFRYRGSACGQGQGSGEVDHE